MKITGMAFLPFLFTSYISPTAFIHGPDPGVGNYYLETTDGSNLELNGNILFDTGIEKSAAGRLCSVIQLKLESNQAGMTHSMGFLISRYERTALLPKGSYPISKNSAGFFSYFDGAFGFADISVLGELPFFAHEGKIIITRIDPYGLEGTLEVIFKNANSKLLKIKGNFKAVKGNLR